MPIAIVQIINNTSHTVRYHNTETGHQFIVPSRAADAPLGSPIPCSNYFNDTLPFSSSGSVEIWLDNGPKANISDSNYTFQLSGPHVTGQSTVKYGHTTNGWNYILRIDTLSNKRGTCAGLSFYVYTDTYKVTSGHIDSNLAQQATPVTGVISMAI